MNDLLSVRQLAKKAGISVRALHLYDELGLLKPHSRTLAGYRMYGEKEVLRLQQVLIYKELEMPLKEICLIMNNRDFDLINALESHRGELLLKSQRINLLLRTIDKTIYNLKNQTMLTPEELYEGMPKNEAAAWRKEAADKWGADKIEQSENALRKLNKTELEILNLEQKELVQQLVAMMNEYPTSRKVQQLIAKHYENIRRFWGVADKHDRRAKAYAGLGELYVNDERYSRVDGKPNPQYAQFMCKAMKYFAETKLKD